MLRLLLLILIVVPAIEIWLLFASGRTFGWVVTLLLVVITGVGGAYLAKRQGLGVWKLAQIQLVHGEVPGQAILDGICIFAGGLLLLTPGFFTDFLSLILLIPYSRAIIKKAIVRWLWKNVQNGKITFIFRK